MHEAWATESRDHGQPRDARDRAHDARLIRAHLVEPRPGPHELRIRQRRRAMNRALDHPRLEAPIDLGVEAVRLVPPAVAQEQAGALAAEREIPVRIENE